MACELDEGDRGASRGGPGRLYGRSVSDLTILDSRENAAVPVDCPIARLPGRLLAGGDVELGFDDATSPERRARLAAAVEEFCRRLFDEGRWTRPFSARSPLALYLVARRSPGREGPSVIGQAPSSVAATTSARTQSAVTTASDW